LFERASAFSTPTKWSCYLIIPLKSSLSAIKAQPFGAIAGASFAALLAALGFSSSG
jgi:hypothetical protein